MVRWVPITFIILQNLRNTVCEWCLRKQKCPLFLSKRVLFPLGSWVASAWTGWWWSRRCLLWLYFSSCVADIMEQHSRASSLWAAAHVQDSSQVPLFISALRNQPFSCFNSNPTACALICKQTVLRASAGASVALCVCVCLEWRTQKLKAHVSTWHHKGAASPAWVWPVWPPELGSRPSRYQS